MKRLISLLLSALLLAGCLSGCETLPDSYTESGDISLPEAVSTPSPESSVFTLGYSSDDTLDPYKAETKLNLELAPLLYEGLTALDGQWMPQLSLAASISKDDPLHPVVTLRDDVLFSDGTPVTAEDVAASFASAKASANYQALLANVSSAAAGDGSVTFTLAGPDPHFDACLSFPVLKSGGGANPIGSGPYMAAGDPVELVRNPHHSGEGMETIQLRHMTDDDTMLYSLESGAISFYFNDLSGGEIPRISNANMSVPVNYLVFIGIRSQDQDLDDPLVRQALSAAISRNAIAESAFAGRAQAAVTPFSPAWGAAVELKGFSAAENLAVAVAQLEQAGYNTEGEEGSNGTSSGNSTGKPLTLSLLYCGSNSFRQATARQLQEQLARTGITLELVDVSYDEYINKLQKNDYDLYLGEIRLSANMSLFPFFTAGGGASFGVDTGGPAADAYRQYLAGELDLQGFCDAFVSDVPFIPLCFRNGIVAYDRNMSGISSTAFNLFYGIENWKMESAA